MMAADTGIRIMPANEGSSGYSVHGSTKRLCKDEQMKIKRQIIVFDAADLAAESTFWAGLLSGTAEADDDWHTVYVDGQPRVAFQLAPDHVPPVWPEGAPQQIHLDLYVDDVKAAHEEAVALGARLLQEADDIESASGFSVYADPAGHPFCLCWG
jgi:predicted enzyme related to lactoylglutathione lyase